MKALISDLKPVMRVIMKNRTVEIVDLARTHRAWALTILSVAAI